LGCGRIPFGRKCGIRGIVRKKLFQSAVAYINIDISVSGFPVFFPLGIPSLTNFVQNAASGIPAPAGSPPTASTIFDLWPAPGKLFSGLGVGSDYGGFLQHIGVPCLSLGFGSSENPEPYSGVYHSIYDNYRWYTNFADLNFQFMKALTQISGILLIRLSTDPLLMFNFTEYGSALLEQIPNLENITAQAGMSLNFQNLRTSVTNVVNSGKVLADFISINPRILSNPLLLRQINDKLIFAERNLLNFQGFAGRPWFRHTVWVTPQYNNYGSTIPFASIIDAISARNSVQAQFEIDFCAVFVQQFSDFLISDL